MDEGSTTEITPDVAERRLRDELARADRTMAGVRPVLRHMLAGGESSLLTDETVACVRAMVRDVARQLLEAQAQAAGAANPPAFVAERLAGLTARFQDHGALLGHLHALALEGQQLERLRFISGLDPVLTPAIEHVAAGEEAANAALAMAVLAAQARFAQHHHRMELALRDLPGDMFHVALTLLRLGAGDDDAAAVAEQRLRSAYDESAARPALLSRFALTLDRSGYTTLAVERVGFSLFATALALAGNEEREKTVLTLAFAPERLALTLRAAGVSPHGVQAQLAVLYPETSVPDGFASLPMERAAKLLADPDREVAL